ncbi:thiamine-binding protein [Natrialbaceae archaeon AArc-T1-2]|nr:thiamine-binding protein [Natrialbaceae archaeon AArc-T1-2]WIV67719.1 thiamine-binding protein [Natrialbaceae archaeon AArc-T1-2]
MTAIARLEIVPIREEHMSDEIASAIEALEEFEVTYELTPMDTIIAADDVGEIFAAAQAAHDEIEEDRIITSLEVDDQPNREQHTAERVAAVEEALGRPPQG